MADMEPGGPPRLARLTAVSLLGVVISASAALLFWGAGSSLAQAILAGLGALAAAVALLLALLDRR